MPFLGTIVVPFRLWARILLRLFCSNSLNLLGSICSHNDHTHFMFFVLLKLKTSKEIKGVSRNFSLRSAFVLFFFLKNNFLRGEVQLFM